MNEIHSVFRSHVLGFGEGPKPPQVYPNPAINELNIESSSLLEQLEICDLSGRPLAKYTDIQNTHFAVDCQFLSTGNYLLKVRSEGKTVVRQVRVQ